MEYGSDKTHNKYIKDKYNCKIDYWSNNHVSINLPGKNYVNIHNIPGDCTAVALNTNEMNSEHFIEFLPIIIDFLSIHGRISAFFSRNLNIHQLESEISALKKFSLIGLHVQHSNRTTNDRYQLTGILKLTNPRMYQTYHSISELTPDHDHNAHWQELVTLNKQLNLEF